jgi:hypothetical protein
MYGVYEVTHKVFRDIGSAGSDMEQTKRVHAKSEEHAEQVFNETYKGYGYEIVSVKKATI